MIPDSKISHSRRSGQDIKKDEYTNEVYPSGSHLYERASQPEKSIYCRYIDSSRYSIPNCNCILGYYDNCIEITLPKEEIEN